MNNSFNIKPTNKVIYLDEVPNVIGRHFTLSQLTYRRIASDGGLIPLNDKFTTIESVTTIVDTLRGNDRVFKHLPGLHLKDIRSATVFLKDRLKFAEKGYQFTYIIHSNNYLLGMVLVNTPSFNELEISAPIWTMDFYLNSFAEGHGIMSRAIHSMLSFLKSNLNVNEKVYFIVDVDNTRCIRLMEKIYANRSSKLYKMGDGGELGEVIQYVYSFNLPVANFEGY